MKNLRKIREQRGLTGEQLAELVGTSQPTINRLERGHDGVTLRMIKRIAKALDVPAWFLMAGDQAEAINTINQAFLSSPPDVQQSWLDMADAALKRHQESV